jgi:Uncharacterised nucleotidyltransferase
VQPTVAGMSPALASALSSLLPTPLETSVLRACLYEGEAGRRAWAECRTQVPDLVALLRDDRLDLRRMAPLLFDALRRNGVEADRGLLTVLRTAHVRESLRLQEYRRVCQAILAAMGAAEVPHLVFRGAALADTVYDHPWLRHGHDLNLLVPPDRLEQARGVLLRAGCAPSEAEEDDAIMFLHPSVLPILLHTRFFRNSYYELGLEEVWSRSVAGTVADRPVRLPAPTHHLLHTCAQASLRPARSSLVWASDAYRLLRHHPDLEWWVLQDAATRSHTRLVAQLALSFLASELQAPVPPAVLEGLGEGTASWSPVERDVALLAARAREGPTLRRILRDPGGWRARLSQLRWLLLPSAGYLRWAYGVRRPVLLPVYYLRRVLRYVRRSASAAPSGSRPLAKRDSKPSSP